jgi:hypothetical protein
MSLAYGFGKGEGQIINIAGAVVANNGKFVPGYTKAGGEVIPNRWEGWMFINLYGQEKSEMIKITGWASRQPKQALDMAETLALYMSKGRSVNLTVQESRYRAQILDAVNKTPLVHSNGIPVTELRMSYNIIGFEFKKESDQLILAEMEAYKAAMANPNIPVDPFSIRSPDWKAPRVQGVVTVWDHIQETRKSVCKYKPGMTKVGHADVTIMTNRNAYAGTPAANAYATPAGVPNMGGQPNMPALPNMGVTQNIQQPAVQHWQQNNVNGMRF